MSIDFNFSGISDRGLIGKILRFPLGFVPAGTVVPILQGNLKGRRWIVGSSTHGCWLGSYEYCKQRQFAEHIRLGNTVFDIGAHVGFYTLLSSVLVGPIGKVCAFEPVPRNLEYLRKHLEINGISNVKVYGVAVSDHAGSAFFDEGPGSSMGHLSLHGILSVKTVMLDDLIARDEIPAPDCIKIDVEGAELAVLKGSKAILMTAHPIVFLATHGPEVHEQCCRFLSSVGYSLQALNGSDVNQCDEILAQHD